MNNIPSYMLPSNVEYDKDQHGHRGIYNLKNGIIVIRNGHMKIFHLLYQNQCNASLLHYHPRRTSRCRNGYQMYVECTVNKCGVAITARLYQYHPVAVLTVCTGTMYLLAESCTKGTKRRQKKSCCLTFFIVTATFYLSTFYPTITLVQYFSGCYPTKTQITFVILHTQHTPVKENQLTLYHFLPRAL